MTDEKKFADFLEENIENDIDIEEIEIEIPEEDGGDGREAPKPDEIERDICREMKDSFLNYAMSVIISRALPDVRDGLKPVQRRIIFGMNELGLSSDKPFKKSARIVGEVMGKFHPHGNDAIYDAMVRMSQDFSFNVPLIDGHGNFGSIDGDGAAAMRYTEARMSKAAGEMIRDLGKNTVDFAENYDGSEKEPEVLPSRFPNLLVNGATGIAVGMATNIPPHNLREVISAVLALIENPKIDTAGLMEHIQGPDFPTGATIMGRSQIHKLYDTGAGAIVLRAKSEIHEDANGKKQIIITEIPYQLSKNKLITEIAKAVKDKTIDGITNLQDHSGRKGMRIVIDLRRDVNVNVIMNNLYRYTPLQKSFSFYMLALDKKQPKLLNLKEILQLYLDFQLEVITRRTQFDLDKAEARAEIVRGLLIALADVDEVVAIIRGSKDTEAAAQALIKKFRLKEIQAKAILDMKLARLTSLEIDKLKEELVNLNAAIKNFQEILGSDDRKREIIAGELTEISNRFGVDRISEIDDNESFDIDESALIPVEDVIITVTNTGYIKRMSADTYRVQNRGGKGVVGTKLVEDDYVDRVIYTVSHDELLFFTDKGMIYRLMAFQIPEYQRTSKGKHILNFLKMDSDEKLAALVRVPASIGEDHFIVFATKNGMIKRTKLSEFKNIHTTGIKAINLYDGDELIKVQITDGKQDIILGASSGKALRFAETDVRPMLRVAAGVRGINVIEGERVVGMAVVSDEDDEVLIATEKGYGKRTKVAAFRQQHRGGRGVKALNINKKNGRLVALTTVTENEDLMIISNDGMVIRMPLQQISTVGRDTQGVKIMDLAGEQTIANLAIVPRAEEESVIAPYLDENYLADEFAEFMDLAGDDDFADSITAEAQADDDDDEDDADYE